MINIIAMSQNSYFTDHNLSSIKFVMNTHYNNPLIKLFIFIKLLFTVAPYLISVFPLITKGHWYR